MRCKTCHYSLANLTEHRCPECGRTFDPNDPTTFDDPIAEPVLMAENLVPVLAVWFVGIACCLGLPALGFLLAGAGHGWSDGWFAGLASWILIPLTIVAWHSRRTAVLPTLFALFLVVAADIWLVWNTFVGHEAQYFRKHYPAMSEMFQMWFLAWFVWQLLLVPTTIQVVQRFRS